MYLLVKVNCVYLSCSYSFYTECKYQYSCITLIAAVSGVAMN